VLQLARWPGSWPDYKGIKTPTVRTYALDGSHCRSLDTRASIASLVVLTNKNFDKVELGEHDASLVHVIDILRPNSPGPVVPFRSPRTSA
jgi:hypothetical protein